MPQGNFKSKGPAKPASLKKGQRQKPFKAKRGGKYIAPKKAKAIENMIVQKQLQKAINSSIEQDMKERASKDATGFKLFKKEKTGDSSKKK
ncbi:UPF0390 protein zgc136864 [Macrobrachium rosenbergii]|uniref:UPF0390 protein zgc136864 n=1 Tax=Macrobrachium rosenbergii TaxID=79674 RepID=UPI0034D4524D